MVCMICCPCSRRTGTLLVGIADLVVGSAALSAVCFLLYIISTEIKELQQTKLELDERLHILSGCKALDLFAPSLVYWSVLLAYGFPAVVTLFTGIFAVFAVSQNNDCCAIASILLTVILVFGCAGILLILYILRIDLPFLIL